MADIFDEIGSQPQETGAGSSDIFDVIEPIVKKKTLGEYTMEEFKSGLKEAFNPSTAQYPGAETIGEYSPTARKTIGSILGAARAAYAIPTAIGKKYVGEPLSETKGGLEAYTPEQQAQMKQFAPAGYEALSQVTPEGNKAAAEFIGGVAGAGLSGIGTGIVRNAPTGLLRLPGRLLDPLASSGGRNLTGKLSDMLQSRNEKVAEVTAQRTAMQDLLDQAAAKKTQQAEMLTNLKQSQEAAKRTRPVMPEAPDVSGVNLSKTVSQATPRGKVAAGEEFGSVVQSERKRLYSESSKNYQNIAKQYGDEIIPSERLQPIVDEAMQLESELRGTPATKRVAMQIPEEAAAPTGAIAALPSPKPERPGPSFDFSIKAAPEAPKPIRLEPRPPQEAPSPAAPPIEKIVMGKSGYRGAEPQLPTQPTPPRISETGYPEGGSSWPSPTEGKYTSTYLAAAGAPTYERNIKPPVTPVEPKGAFEPVDRVTKWIEGGEKSMRNMPIEAINRLTELEKSGQLTTDSYRQVIADMLGGGEKPINVSKLIRLDQVLSEASRSYGNSGNIAARSAVRQMQSKVQDVLSGTAAAPALSEAKKFHAQISELVGPDSLSQKVFNLKPDQVVANVFLPAETGTRPNVSMIREAKKIYQAQNPEAWTDLTASALEQLQRTATDLNSGTLDPTKFQRNWARYGETFKEALEPEQYGAVKAVADTISKYNMDRKTALQLIRENTGKQRRLAEAAKATKERFAGDITGLKEQVAKQKDIMAAGAMYDKYKDINPMMSPYTWLAVAQVGQALQASFTGNMAGVGRQLAQGVVWYTLGNPAYLHKMLANPNLARALSIISGTSKGIEEGTRNARYVRMLLDDISKDMETNAGNEGQNSGQMPVVR